MNFSTFLTERSTRRSAFTRNRIGNPSYVNENKSMAPLKRLTPALFCFFLFHLDLFLYLISFFPSSSSTNINKHWEAELAALKGNNAKLTAALLESTANVKQWKQQLAAYQEEAERLHKRVKSAGAPLGSFLESIHREKKLEHIQTHCDVRPFGLR